MRFHVLLFFLVVFAGWELAVGQQANSSQKPSSLPFSISISGPTEAEAGSEIEIRIRITNTADHEIDMSPFYVSGVDLGFKYEVRDHTGGLAEKKDLPRSGSLAEIRLAPGQNTEEGTLVSRAVSMTHPGQYTIQLSRATGGPKDLSLPITPYGLKALNLAGHGV